MLLRATAGIRTPGEKLLARDDAMIGNAHDPGVLAVVIAGQKLFLVIPGKHRVGTMVVLIPTDVDAGSKIRAVEPCGGNRPGRKGPLRMIGHELRAWRKDDLVVVVYVNRDVTEAEHRRRYRRLVDHAERCFEIGFSRVQRQPNSPAHAIPQFQFTYPDCL